MKYRFEGSLILGEDEDFKPYMGIDRAIGEGLKLSDQEITALYQDRLRRILESYMNVYYPVSYLMKNSILNSMQNIFSLPFLKKILLIEPGQSFFSHLFLPLELIANHFDKPLVGDAQKLLSKLKNNNNRASAFNPKVSRLISECYNLLDILLEHSGLNSCSSKCSKIKTYDKATFENQDLHSVVRMQSILINNFNDYVVGTYLHGSLSTLDFTPFSDMDVLHIVKKDVLKSGSSIRELSQLNLELSVLLYQHDWLQHHRFHIVSEYDLDWYNPSYMPPEVFDHATVLCGPGKVEFCVRSPMLSAYEHIWGCIQNLRRSIKENFKSIDNIWKLKDLVSLVSFLPVLYLGIKRDFCYKKDSYDRAKKDFTDNEWKAVELATKIRYIWQPFEGNKSQTTMKDALLIKHKNPVLFQEIMASSSEPIPKYLLDEINSSQFYSSISVFVEAIANRMRGLNNGI